MSRVADLVNSYLNYLESDQKLTWKYVESDEVRRAAENADNYDNNSARVEGEEVRLYINLPASGGLGCSICSGPSHLPGIFVQSVKLGSLAERAGLEVGDQLLSVNGTSFHDIRHSEAVVALKGSHHLDITLKKGVGTDLFLHRNHGDHTDLFSVDNNQDNGSEELGNVLRSRECIPLSSSHESDLVDIEPPEIQNGSNFKAPDGTTIQPVVSKINHPSPHNNGGFPQRDEEQLSEVRVDTDHNNWASHTHQASSSLEKNMNNKPVETERRSGHDLGSLWSGGYWRNDTQGHQGSNSEEFTTSYKTMQGPTYMSSERTPSFRFQKPVLLSPVSSASSLQNRNSYRSTNGHHDSDRLGGFNPYRIFTNEQIDGRQVGVVTINKQGTEDLGLLIETTAEGNTPGQVIVSEIYEGGAIQKHGGIDVGDQLMMVESTSLLDVSLTQAHSAIKHAYRSQVPTMKLVVAKARPTKQEEEVVPHRHPETLHTSELDDLAEDMEGNYDICTSDVPITII